MQADPPTLKPPASPLGPSPPLPQNIRVQGHAVARQISIHCHRESVDALFSLSALIWIEYSQKVLQLLVVQIKVFTVILFVDREEHAVARDSLVLGQLLPH
eukprot:444284-Rhodomonas_salina.1